MGEKLRSCYDHGPDTHLRGGVDCSVEESRTQQEFRDECDINKMMKAYMKTGTVEPTAAVGRYGDFSSVPDFHMAQNIIALAHEQFDALPAHVRRRFDNDPARMLEFVGDRANLEEARKLGLLVDESSGAIASTSSVPVASPPAVQPPPAPSGGVPPAK